MNSAQLRLIQKRLSQQKQPASDPIVDQTASEMPLANGGFRAGKRKRGHSPLKRKPRASTVVTSYIMRDEHGNNLGTVKTLTYKRP